MPEWIWYVLAGLIVLGTLFVFYLHFFRKKGDCCGDCGKCNKSCKK